MYAAAVQCHVRSAVSCNTCKPCTLSPLSLLSSKTGVSTLDVSRSDIHYFSVTQVSMFNWCNTIASTCASFSLSLPPFIPNAQTLLPFLWRYKLLNLTSLVSCQHTLFFKQCRRNIRRLRGVRDHFIHFKPRPEHRSKVLCKISGLWRGRG